MYECMACHERFKNLQAAQNHQSLARAICPYCNFQATRHHNLASHISNIHTEIRPEDYPSCDKCGKTFKKYTSLLFHQRVVCEKKSTKCDHCEFRTKYENAMRQHIAKNHRTESNQDGLYCPKCDRVYRSKARFDKHIKICTGKPSSKIRKTYECYHCGVKSKRKINLIEHLQKKHFDIVGKLDSTPIDR